jgi:uncharacterized protein
MADKQKVTTQMRPIIRTITGFIKVSDLGKLDTLLEKLRTLKSRFEQAGYEIQTIRLTTDLLEAQPSNLGRYEKLLSRLDNESLISIYHLGTIDDCMLLGKAAQAQLLELFLAHPKAFMTVSAHGPSKTKSCQFAARLCRKIALSKPFECRRFALYAGVTDSTPFYPASRVFSNSLRFAIGFQCANLAVEEAEAARRNLACFEVSLRKRLESEFRQVQSLIPSVLKKDFIGFDTSLAPFPSKKHSIANAIELLLGKPFGSSGTLSVCRLLTKVMKENKLRKTGLCGLMLPVIEDNVLAKRGIEGRYTLRDLLLFSSVCATGLDTLPISGKTTEQELALCYLDLATLSEKLKKPLSARFFIEPKKLPGGTIKYKWEFACESPVFKV